MLNGVDNFLFIIQDKVSVDVPDLINGCKGKWEDMKQNKIAIEISECDDCDDRVPIYWHAVQREQIYKQEN